LLLTFDSGRIIRYPWPHSREPCCDAVKAGEVCKRAVEIAYRAGIFTILYVGNDEIPHRLSPLTDKHRNIVAAVKECLRVESVER